MGLQAFLFSAAQQKIAARNTARCSRYTIAVTPLLWAHCPICAGSAQSRTSARVLSRAPFSSASPAALALRFEQQFNQKNFDRAPFAKTL
jgi:hypothetical protein